MKLLSFSKNFTKKTTKRSEFVNFSSFSFPLTDLRNNYVSLSPQPGEDYRVGICGPSFAGPHYDPTNQPAGAANYSQRCTPKTPEGCEIGDLTGKLGAVNVAAIPAPYATDSFFFTDSRLNLTGFQGVVNRSVVVHIAEGGSNRLSCAPLVEAENLTLTAYPIGGQPLAIISQYSRYQNTIISLGSLPCELGGKRERKEEG